MGAEDPKVLRAVRTPHWKVSHGLAPFSRSLRGFTRELDAIPN